jgi:hypothetical protein
MSVSATSAHPLDHPIWSALTTRQQALAEGGALARRYPFAIAPFAARWTRPRRVSRRSAR